MKSRQFVFLLLLSLFGFGANFSVFAQPVRPNQTDANGTRVGLWEFKDKNGKLLSRGKYDSNGQRDGEWRFYISPVGRHTQEPDVVGNYRGGQRHGEWQCIDSRTRTLLRGRYADDKMIGSWTYYDRKGRKLATGQFNEQNIRHGEWTVFRNNSPMSKGQYDNGVQNGRWAFDYYHEDSSTHVIGTFDYANGTRAGEFQHFKVLRHPKFPTQETLVGHGSFQNGKKTGRWIEYTAGFKGERIETGYYDGNGKRTGAWETTINGHTAQECYYNDGKRQGTFKTYFENGKPKYVSSFERDLEHGFFTSYYESGKMKEKGAYTLLEKADASEDTIFYKIELPYEFNLRLIDADIENFNYNCIAWIADVDYSIPAEELEKRYTEALSYGQSGGLRVAEIIRNDKQAVRVGEFKSFYENGKVSLEGRFLPYFHVTKISETSTEKSYARDGIWKEYDELGYNRKNYYYDKGELRKVVDGNGKDLSIKDNRLK